MCGRLFSAPWAYALAAAIAAACGPVAVLGGTPAPGRFLDAPGGAVRHYAALGLPARMDAGVVRVIGTATKHAANPLFGQDRPWEPRLDNAYVNCVTFVFVFIFLQSC